MYGSPQKKEAPGSDRSRQLLYPLDKETTGETMGFGLGEWISEEVTRFGQAAAQPRFPRLWDGDSFFPPAAGKGTSPGRFTSCFQGHKGRRVSWSHRQLLLWLETQNNRYAFKVASLGTACPAPHHEQWWSVAVPAWQEPQTPIGWFRGPVPSRVGAPSSLSLRSPRKTFLFIQRFLCARAGL